MKIFLVLVGLTLFTDNSSATSIIPSKTYSRQDTISAIHKLFTQKRSMAKAFVSVGGLGMVFGAARQSVFMATAGLASASFGLVRFARFRKHREIAVLQNYHQGAGLPWRVRRQLKANYFD